jgi:hypothetical protein
MRWNRISVPLIALTSACGIGHAIGAEVCAAKSQTIRSFMVFDVPPSELASLVPEQTGENSGYWELGYVYDAGRSAWVHCQYSDGTSAGVQLSTRIGKCEYEEFKNDTFKLYHRRAGTATVLPICWRQDRRGIEVSR